VSDGRPGDASDGLSPDASSRATGDTTDDETAEAAGLRTERLEPPIRRVVESLQAVGASVCRLVRPLTGAQLNWRPSNGRWSIAECIAHLTATGNLYLPPIDGAIERGLSHGRRGREEFRPGPIGRWLIAQMEPPPRRRLPTLRRLTPRGLERRETLLADFDEMQRALAHRVIAANGLDLQRIRMRSPLIPVLWLSLGSWFAFIAAHERRHLWQAMQVRGEVRFPR
jgi:hypothetical protein